MLRLTFPIRSLLDVILPWIPRALILSFAFSIPLQAQSTWTGTAAGGSERWNRPGNWDNLLPPILPIQDGVFQDTTGNTNVEVRGFFGTPTIVVPRTLTFTNVADAYSINIITGSELRPQTIELNGSGDVTLFGPGLFRSQILSGNVLTINGTGSSLFTVAAALSDGLLGAPTTLRHDRSDGITVLNTASTFTGGTELLAGTLLLGDDSALGTGPLTISAMTTLGTSGVPVDLSVPVTILGDFSVRSGSDDLELTGPIDLGTAPLTVTLAEDGSFLCFAGPLSGASSLTLLLGSGASSGTVVLCGPDNNSFPGPLIIGNGVEAQLQKDPGILALAGDLIIQNGGFLQVFEDLAQIAPTATVTVDGTLEFFRLGLAGSETASFAELNGAGTITNTLTGATLEVGSGLFSGVITDSGISGGELSLVKSGTGTLTLTGANTYNGTTTVNGGALVVNGSLGNTIVTIGNGATLGGSGSILGPVTVLAGGTLSPGTSPGILTVGALTLSPGSTTIFEINGLTPGLQHDQIVVTGTANLDGTVQLLFGGGFTPSDGASFTLLQAGAVNGQFANFTSNLGAVFSLNLIYDPTTVQLLVTLTQQNYTLFALNQNQFNVAANLDTFSRTGQMPELITLLNSLDAAHLASALQQISPEALGAMDRMARHYNRAQGRNLFNRLSEWRISGGGIAGTVSTSSLRLMDWAAQPLYAGTRMRDYTPVSLDSVANPSWSLFASGTGQFGDINGDGNGTGYDFQTGGMTVGADKNLGAILGGQVVAGIYAGYAGSEAKIDNSGGRIEANGGKFGVFGSWVNEGLYANAQVGGGVTNYDTRRNVLGQRQTGEVQGYEFTTETALGYEWTCGGWRFGPEGSLAYDYVGIERFTESGGLAPLTVLDRDLHSLQTRLGWTATYEYLGNHGWWLRPGVNLSWAHEFLKVENAIDARLASGAGGVFQGIPTKVGRDTAIAGASLTLGQGQSWNAWIAYEAEAGHRILVHSINAGAAIKF
ncbi:MAG: hypothetical protein OHK005_16120 [Candidatus Methylacidiphilales bacterium]